MCSSIDSSTEVRSIENYDFQFSKFEFQHRLLDLFRVSFFTTLDIYKAYFKRRHIPKQRPRNLFSLLEAIAFVSHRVLQPSASKSSLLIKRRTLQLTTFVQVAGVGHVLGSVQMVSHRLEICASRKRKLLHDQVQLSIRMKVQL